MAAAEWQAAAVLASMTPPQASNRARPGMMGGGTRVTLGRNNGVVKKLCTVLTRWNTLERDAERVRQQLRGRRERRGEMTEVVLERRGGEQSLRC